MLWMDGFFGVNEMGVQFTIDNDGFGVLIEKTTRIWDYYNKGITKQWLRKVANEFRLYLTEAIVTQEFESSWPDLSDKYYEWKMKNHLSLDFWMQFGELYKSFTLEERANGYSVTLPDTYPSEHKSIFGPKYKAQEVTILEYGIFMEYGRGRSFPFRSQPPRPLLRPALKAFKARRYKDLEKSHRQYLDRLWKGR